MPPRPVVIDTNFLLLPFQYKIDILKELEYLIESSHRYVISSRTLKELQSVGRSIGKNGMAARLAIKLIEANRAKFEVVESERYVDDWIVDYSKAKKAIVCTNDSELRRKLKDMDIPVITMKSRSKLGYI